jgi:hypothetical protein
MKLYNPTIARWCVKHAPIVTGNLRARVIKDIARDLADGKTVRTVYGDKVICIHLEQGKIVIV